MIDGIKLNNLVQRKFILNGMQATVFNHNGYWFLQLGDYSAYHVDISTLYDILRRHNVEFQIEQLYSF